MDFFVRNMDYVLFVYGLSFILLAVLCRGLARDARDRLPWSWLGLFGLYHGFSKWLDVLAFSSGDSDGFLAARLVLLLVSFVALLEFGRSGYRSKGKPRLGPWLLPALTLASVAAGWNDGLAGLHASARYFIAFPGSVLGLLVLAPSVPPGTDSLRRRGMIFAAAGLLAFGLTQWIAPTTALFPADRLNEAAFADRLGVPVQLWRAIAMLAMIGGLWLYRQRLGSPDQARALTWLPPLLLVTLLGAGWAGAEWRGRNRQALQQDRLLEQVSALARAINPDDAKALAFAPEDGANVRHQRLHAQLEAARRLIKCRSIFTLALRQGRLVYGPCASGGEDEPFPGDVYQPAPREDITSLFRGDPYIVGPVLLRGRPVFSARAPIRNLKTGQVLMTIGLDVDTGPWLSAHARARLIPITGTMLLLLALLVGIDLIRSRNELPVERHGVRRHLEAFLILLCGAVVTLFAALLIQESETRRRHSIFDRLADSRTTEIRNEILAIRADLQSLALFFQSSDFVSRSEFATFAGSIAQVDAVEGFAWIPLVPAGRKAAFEAEAAREQAPGFRIWERDSQKRNKPAGVRALYYPLLYIEPPEDHIRGLGFDLGSDPGVEPVLRQALQSGLWTATPCLPLAHQDARSPAMLVLQPAFGSGTGPITGLAGALIRFENLLGRASTRSGLGERFVHLGLVDMTDGNRPQIIAVQPGKPEAHPRRLDDISRIPLANLQPIFAFGRTFAVICHPTAVFWNTYPLRGGMNAAAGGLTLSVLVALFVAFLRKRQWDLEREVHQRTEALRLSQENLAITLNSIGDGVIATDAKGIIRQMNPAAERLTGWPATDAEGRPLHTVFHIINSRTRKPVLNPVDHVVASGSVVGLANHTALISRTGAERQIADSAAPIRDPSGRTVGVVLVFSDVTQEYADRLKLEESELQYRLLAEHASDVIGRMSPDGRMLFLSPSLRHVLGYEPDELVGQSLASLIHPDDAGKAVAKMKKALADPGGVSVILRTRHKDGRFRWMETAARRMLHPETQEPQEIITVSRDITDRRQAEEERLEMERHLFHAQKLESLGVLTGGIAHDFNNLLTAVLGNLELAQLALPPGAPARGGVEQAIHASRRAADLTRQMLSYSGKGLFAVKDVNLNDLVDENANMLKAAISKTVALNLTLAPDLPPIRADASQLQQIVMNLITNASEAIGDRPGVVTLATGLGTFDESQLASSRIPEKPRPGPFAWLEVGDTGSGMTAQTQSRIFEPFFTTKFTGRGLGMSVVLGIMRGHKGALFISSQPGHGTTIRVLFPAKPNRSASPAPRPVPPARTEQPALFETRPDRPPGTVLIVDDEQIVQDICAAAVAYSGYKTLTASDGQEGVEVYRAHADEIVAVILDLTMPRMDGATAFREMRKIRPAVRVILSSGHAEEEAFRRFDTEGTAGFLQKPYELKALQNELERVIRGRVHDA